jgi:hypothetical protein
MECRTPSAYCSPMQQPVLARLGDGRLVLVVEASPPLAVVSPALVTISARGTLADTLAVAEGLPAPR